MTHLTEAQQAANEARAAARLARCNALEEAALAANKPTHTVLTADEIDFILDRLVAPAFKRLAAGLDAGRNHRDFVGRAEIIAGHRDRLATYARLINKMTGNTQA